MKLENFEQIGKLRQRLIDVDKKIATFATMNEPSMTWAWHGGLMRAEVRHPHEYRAGSVEIDISTDYVAGALKIQRHLVVSQLRELGVWIEKA